VRTVIPGHGEPFGEVRASLDYAYQRLAAFEADDERVARYGAKAIFSYALLHRRRFPEAQLPAYVDTVGFFRDLNAAVLRMAPEALAAWLVDDLVRAGAIRHDGADLVPVTGEAG